MSSYRNKDVAFHPIASSYELRAHTQFFDFRSLFTAMFLQKLRVVANFCQKQGIVREVFRSQRQPTLTLPSVTIFSRQFSSRFYDDDDDSDDNSHPPQRKPTGSFQSNNQRGFGQNTPQTYRSQFNRNQSSDRFSNNFSANRQNNNNSQFGALPTPKWDLSTLEEVQKNFYQPHEKTLNRSAEEIAKFHTEHEITLPIDAPKPILEFDELTNVPKSLLDVIEKHKFEKASPIQAQAWPIALSGQNLVGIAQTG